MIEKINHIMEKNNKEFTKKYTQRNKHMYIVSFTILKEFLY